MVVVTRPLRGSRLASFYPPAPEDGPSLSDLDSAFQFQEYITLLIRKNPHDVETIVTPPGRVKKGEQDDKSDPEGKNEGVDEACWIYEQLRRLAQDLTHPLVTSLQQECTRASCPEMKAGEWLYLCVAHGNDGAMECCAIDYIIHTLDSATALLNSPRAFPSRISIPQSSIRHFSSLARRLGRIFAHAYFHHREAFEASEAENSLYARFLALTARFDLVPPEFLVIPPRMVNPDSSSTSSAGGDAEPPRLLGAALHPEPAPYTDIGVDKDLGSTPGPSVMESPRKAGRNRTDTMILSDVEAFNEAMRGQAGSPSAGQESTASPTGQTGGFGFEISGGIPRVDSLEVVADSGETCRPISSDSESKGEKEAKPYTLTFSASGTVKTALPPGISPSSSNSNGLGLAPSPLQPPSFNNGNNQGNLSIQDAEVLKAQRSGRASQIDDFERGRAFADSVNLEERAPASEGMGDDSGDAEGGDGDGDAEESALGGVLSQELSQEELLEQHDESGDTRLIDLLARKQVLEGHMQEVDLHNGASEWTERASEGSEGEFVVIGNESPEDDRLNEAAEAGAQHDGQPLTNLLQDSGVKVGETTASISEVSTADKEDETPAADPETAQDSSPSEKAESGSNVTESTGKLEAGGKEPDAPLEVEVADAGTT